MNEQHIRLAVLQALIQAYPNDYAFPTATDYQRLNDLAAWVQTGLDPQTDWEAIAP